MRARNSSSLVRRMVSASTPLPIISPFISIVGDAETSSS
jgi:hypothetical protein